MARRSLASPQVAFLGFFIPRPKAAWPAGVGDSQCGFLGWSLPGAGGGPNHACFACAISEWGPAAMPLWPSKPHLTNGRIAHERKLECTSQAGKEAQGKQGLVYGEKCKPQMSASCHSEFIRGPTHPIRGATLHLFQKTWVLGSGNWVRLRSAKSL